jgi:hypothetical protein
MSNHHPSSTKPSTKPKISNSSNSNNKTNNNPPTRPRASSSISLTTTVESVIWNALCGRGLRPYSLWLVTIGFPTLVLFWNLRHDESVLSWSAWIFAGLFATWTIPPETLGQAIIDVGKFRNALADIIPILPQIATKLPKLIAAAAPILPQLLPHLGTVAPHLPALLPHAEFLTRILPKLTSRIDDLIPLVEKVGPKFKDFTPEHFEKLELIIDDVVERLDILAPHIDALLPIITDGILVAPKMLPHIEKVIPHLASLEKDLAWLLPFAEIEGVEEMLPYLDKIAPRIHELEPFAEIIGPQIGKLKKHLPLLANDLDVLLDVVPETIDHLDPLLYWFGDILPYASKMGILKSSTLLRATAPVMVRYLPAVPPPRTPARPAAGSRNMLTSPTYDRIVTVPRTRIVHGATYYVIEVDGRYAGEFRYRYVRELHLQIQDLLLTDSEAPEFPSRWFVPYNAYLSIEDRRKKLERYLVYVMSDSKIVKTKAFEHFIKVRRRWGEELPLLKSPLLN